MPPMGKYRERIWTCGPVGFEKLPNLLQDDFAPLVEQVGLESSVSSTVAGSEVHGEGGGATFRAPRV